MARIVWIIMHAGEGMAARAVAVSIFLWATTGLALAQPAPLPDSERPVVLGPHVEVLEDEGGTLTLDEVRTAASQGKFRASQAQVPNFGYTRSTWWLRFRLPRDVPA